MTAFTSNQSSSPDGPRALRVLEIGIWFGLLTGVGEVFTLGVRKFYFGQVVRAGLDVVWMSPLADAGVFLVPALALALLIRWRSDVRLLPASIFAFASFAAFSLLLMHWQLALYAKALLAAGFGLQAARLIARRSQGFQLLVHRSLPWMAGLLVVSGAGIQGWQWIAPQQAAAAAPPVGRRTPNLLVIVLDTVRAQNLSLYGYSRETTPTLDRLAGSSVVFDRAIAAAPWTLPSHASIFTGRWPHELSADWEHPLDASYPTLAEVLRDRGYATAGFAANTFYCTHEFGLDRGFLHYEDYSVSLGQLAISSAVGRTFLAYSLEQNLAYRFRGLIGYYDIPGRKRAGDVNGSFLRWLSRRDPDKPYFAFLNYLDAHQPFLAPPPFQLAFLGATPRGDPRHTWDRKWSAEEIRTEMGAYDGAIAYMDYQLGLLFDELAKRGDLDNTVVLITSDHGEHFGEHGFMRHATTLYMPLLHVPLMIRYPAATGAGVRVREGVTLRDIPATALALLGVDCQGCLPGESLTRYWGPGADGSAKSPSASPLLSEVTKGIELPERYPVANADMRSLVLDELHYINGSDGSEEIYNLAEDPNETRNLVQALKGSEAYERLARHLTAIPARRGPGE